MSVITTVTYDPSKPSWLDRFSTPALESHVWGQPFPTNTFFVDWLITYLSDDHINLLLGDEHGLDDDQFVDDDKVSGVELKSHPLVVYKLLGDFPPMTPTVRIIPFPYGVHPIPDAWISKLQTILQMTPVLKKGSRGGRICGICLTNSCTHL